MKKSIKIAVLAVIILSLCGCRFIMPNSPEAAAKRIFAAAQNCDFVTLEQLLYNPEDYEYYEYYIEEMADSEVKDIQSWYDYFASTDLFSYMKHRVGEKAFDDYIDACVDRHKIIAKRSRIEIDDVDVDDDEACVEVVCYIPKLEMDMQLGRAIKNLDLEEEYENDELDEKEWTKVMKELSKLCIKEAKEVTFEEIEYEWYFVKDDGKWKYKVEDNSLLLLFRNLLIL